MGILERNQKREVRFEKGEIALYEPTEFQKDEIYSLLENQNITLQEGKIEGEIDVRFVRYVLKECSTLGAEIDEYSNEKLDSLLSNGNRNVQLFMRSVEDLCNELVEDYFYVKEKEVKIIIKIMDILNANLTQMELEKKFNNLMKRNKVNLTLNEFVENKDNPEKLKEIIKNSKKKNGKRK